MRAVSFRQSPRRFHRRDQEQTLEPQQRQTAFSPKGHRIRKVHYRQIFAPEQLDRQVPTEATQATHAADFKGQVRAGFPADDRAFRTVPCLRHFVEDVDGQNNNASFPA